jgi:uncharacterized protein
MLIEFRVKNYRSFRDEAVLSLVANSDKSLENNYVQVGNLRLLKSVGIYGPNACGKSNLIKAVNTMQRIVLDSAGWKPDAKLPVKPFLMDPKTAEMPSRFEVAFYLDGVRYQYGFSAKPDCIVDEWLLAYPKSYSQIWFERTFVQKTNDYEWKFSPYFKGEKAKLSKRTKRNSLLLSVGASWNNDQLTKIYTWFRKQIRVVPPRESMAPITAKMLFNAESANKKIRKDLHSLICHLLKSADLGIDDVIIKKKEFEKNQLSFIDRISKEFPPDVRESVAKEILDQFDVKISHKLNADGNKVSLPLDEESEGTQRFFELIGPWFEAIVEGYVVFVDELERSLHPLLVRNLVEFIHASRKKGANAQLIFATHDTTLLEPSLLRRDQVWLIEKSNDQASRLYPLTDYKPRKDEAMQKGYLAGRYGAIPVLESFAEK